MLEHINLSNLLFLDIETVSQEPDFAFLSEEFQQLWEMKSSYFRSAELSAAEVYQRAAIYAEFGKVVCISVGKILEKEGGELGFKVKSFYGDDEKQLLENFADLLRKQKNNTLLCAHNGKEFDFPFLSRRMLINGVKLPDHLDNSGKRPWEIAHLDTLELWKFGDYKNYTSLRLMAAVFNLPTPKDDIDGSQVGAVYWNDHDLERIRIYCEKDVVTVAQLILRMKGQNLIDAESIVSIS